MTSSQGGWWEWNPEYYKNIFSNVGENYQIVWSGVMQWLMIPNDGPMGEIFFKNNLPCSVIAESKGGLTEFHGCNWSNITFLKLMEKNVVSQLDQRFAFNSKRAVVYVEDSNRFSSTVTEAIEANFAGCLFFYDSKNPDGCNNKIAILNYAISFGLFAAIIPNDTTGFYSHLHEVSLKNKNKVSTNSCAQRILPEPAIPLMLPPAVPPQDAQQSRPMLPPALFNNDGNQLKIPQKEPITALPNCCKTYGPLPQANQLQQQVTPQIQTMQSQPVVSPKRKYRRRQADAVSEPSDFCAQTFRIGSEEPIIASNTTMVQHTGSKTRRLHQPEILEAQEPQPYPFMQKEALMAFQNAQKVETLVKDRRKSKKLSTPVCQPFQLGHYQNPMVQMKTATETYGGRFPTHQFQFQAPLPYFCPERMSFPPPQRMQFINSEKIASGRFPATMLQKSTEPWVPAIQATQSSTMQESQVSLINSQRKIFPSAAGQNLIQTKAPITMHEAIKSIQPCQFGLNPSYVNEKSEEYTITRQPNPLACFSSLHQDPRKYQLPLKEPPFTIMSPRREKQPTPDQRQPPPLMPSFQAKRLIQESNRDVLGSEENSLSGKPTWSRTTSQNLSLSTHQNSLLSLINSISEATPMCPSTLLGNYMSTGNANPPRENKSMFSNSMPPMLEQIAPLALVKSPQDTNNSSNDQEISHNSVELRNSFPENLQKNTSLTITKISSSVGMEKTPMMIPKSKEGTLSSIQLQESFPKIPSSLSCTKVQQQEQTTLLKNVEPEISIVATDLSLSTEKKQHASNDNSSMTPPLLQQSLATYFTALLSPVPAVFEDDKCESSEQNEQSSKSLIPATHNLSGISNLRMADNDLRTKNNSTLVPFLSPSDKIESSSLPIPLSNINCDQPSTILGDDKCEIPSKKADSVSAEVGTATSCLLPNEDIMVLSHTPPIDDPDSPLQSSSTILPDSKTEFRAGTDESRVPLTSPPSPFIKEEPYLPEMPPSPFLNSSNFTPPSGKYSSVPTSVITISSTISFSSFTLDPVLSTKSNSPLHSSDSSPFQVPHSSTENLEPLLSTTPPFPILTLEPILSPLPDSPLFNSEIDFTHRTPSPSNCLESSSSSSSPRSLIIAESPASTSSTVITRLPKQEEVEVSYTPPTPPASDMEVCHKQILDKDTLDVNDNSNLSVSSVIFVETVNTSLVDENINSPSSSIPTIQYENTSTVSENENSPTLPASNTNNSSTSIMNDNSYLSTPSVTIIQNDNDSMVIENSNISISPVSTIKNENTLLVNENSNTSILSVSSIPVHNTTDMIEDTNPVSPQQETPLSPEPEKEEEGFENSSSEDSTSSNISHYTHTYNGSLVSIFQRAGKKLINSRIEKLQRKMNRLSRKLRKVQRN